MRRRPSGPDDDDDTRSLCACQQKDILKYVWIFLIYADFPFGAQMPNGDARSNPEGRHNNKKHTKKQNPWPNAKEATSFARRAHHLYWFIVQLNKGRRVRRAVMVAIRGIYWPWGAWKQLNARERRRPNVCWRSYAAYSVMLSINTKKKNAVGMIYANIARQQFERRAVQYGESMIWWFEEGYMFPGHSICVLGGREFGRNKNLHIMFIYYVHIMLERPSGSGRQMVGKLNQSIMQTRSDFSGNNDLKPPHSWWTQVVSGHFWHWLY